MLGKLQCIARPIGFLGISTSRHRRREDSLARALQQCHKYKPGKVWDQGPILEEHRLSLDLVRTYIEWQQVIEYDLKYRLSISKASSGYCFIFVTKLFFQEFFLWWWFCYFPICLSCIFGIYFKLMKTKLCFFFFTWYFGGSSPPLKKCMTFIEHC